MLKAEIDLLTLRQMNETDTNTAKIQILEK